LWSTTSEVLAYARFHLMERATKASPVLSADSIRAMQTPRVPIPGATTVAMGMNWFVQDVPGLRLFAHDGDTVGQHTEFVAAPGRDFALVLLTNNVTGGLAALPVLVEAAAQYLGR